MLDDSQDFKLQNDETLQDDTDTPGELLNGDVDDSPAEIDDGYAKPELQNAACQMEPHGISENALENAFKLLDTGSQDIAALENAIKSFGGELPNSEPAFSPEQPATQHDASRNENQDAPEQNTPNDRNGHNASTKPAEATPVKHRTLHEDSELECNSDEEFYRITATSTVFNSFLIFY